MLRTAYTRARMLMVLYMIAAVIWLRAGIEWGPPIRVGVGFLFLAAAWFWRDEMHRRRPLEPIPGATARRKQP